MDISATLINDTNLSRLDLHILGPGYLEEKISSLTEVITEDKIQEITKKPEVSDSKEKKKRQMTLQKEKKDAQAATCLSAGYLRGFFADWPMSGLSVLFISAPSASAGFVLPVSRLSALSASAGSAEFAMPMPHISAPLASA